MIGLYHRGARTGGGGRNIRLRIGSAVVLAPLVLAAAYAGGRVFLGLCAVASAGILWEWTRLVTGRSDPRLLGAGGAALVAALALVGLGDPGAAFIVIGAGAALAGTIAAVGSARRTGWRGALWAAGGVLYAGVAFLGPALLRRDAELGFRAFLFLAASVWMTDVCAYAVGRTVGGPLLWPRVSPNKTWAGAIGGLVGGVAGGLVVAYAGGTGGLAVVGVIALVLSAIAQAGDLFESAVKRRFGAKDSSQLIPGHGGLMDRLDGFLVAALTALAIGVLHQGTAAPAHGLLLW
ncbi:MAG: phosphatidate cytidylyltransferase [Xanthobacteraceae bacterium]